MKGREIRNARLAKAVSVALGMTGGSAAGAQDVTQDDTRDAIVENEAVEKDLASGTIVEEVVVTGIRSSLRSSMNVKRDSDGVVEAITAEDIGKFPDTNLAESLQRIPGVSIDRTNNEGSKVTVRGFGPEFNLVLLNGRQMPTSDLDNNSTRSFEFANLASEGVSAVEVFKTFNATKPSGGIGSTIDIKTNRPLDKPGLVASFGVKALKDTTNEEGDDVTPEYSGIFSSTFFEDKLGIGFFFSHQERDSRIEGGEAALWRENIDDLIPDTTVVTDNRTEETNTWYPRNYGYGIEDINRTRDNGQLTLQYAPTEDITATFDYTYSEFDNKGERIGVGIWFGDFPQTTEVEIDENGTYVFVEDQCCDYASNKRLNKSKNENTSLGFNLNWHPTDNLNLSFDYHDSEAESKGEGRGNDVFLILAANNIVTKSMDSRNGRDLPQMLVTWDETAPGVVDGLPTAGTYDSLFGQAGLNINKSDVNQFQLDGRWDNSNSDDGLVSIQFGAASTDMKYRTRSFNTGQIAAGWYGGNQDVYDDSIFTEENTGGLLDEFSGGGNQIEPTFYYDWDFNAGVTSFEDAFNDGNRLAIDSSGTPIFDHKIKEETDAFYLQFNTEGEFDRFPWRMNGGLRYEKTDVTANSLQIDTEAVVWVNSTEWSVIRADDQTVTDEEGSYDLWLPNLDFSVDVVEDVIARFSYSKSVTRPPLVDMQGTTSVTDRPKPSERTGNAGNPDLDPFTSDNFDLSVEWYYGASSYVSVGYYHKQVENFIVTRQLDRIINDLRDPSEGPRAEQARADITAAGGDPDDPVQVHDQININMGMPVGTPIEQAADDPLIDWMITQPANLETADLYGWEFSVQHFFWDTGFGMSANWTIVDGDVDPDNGEVGFQFVLPGLSDSANVVAFFENDFLQARVAYNWRDEFLSGTADNQPQYTESFGQVDANISFFITDQLSVFVEGLNLTDESQRIYNRYEEQLIAANQFGARYAIGARYTFE